MDTTDKKAQRFRSVAYPSYTLSGILDFVKSIYQQFGNSTFNSREEIAQVLGTGVGTLLMRLSTATQYGLLEMKSKEGYKPTQLFTSLYKPLSEDEKYNAQVECLANSDLYNKLIGQFTGKKLPTLEGLSILLYRSYKVSEDASIKAAKIFLENLSETGLIDENNQLLEGITLEKKLEQNGEIKKTDEFNYTHEPIRNQLNYTSNVIEAAGIPTDSAPPIPIFLKGENRIAKLLMPSGFDDNDLDQVIKVISVYKKG